MSASFGCVVLTQGGRPEILRLALDSLLRQEGVDVDVVVVVNGREPLGLPDGVLGIGLPVDLGAAGGRNAGVPHVAGELIFFLDDDAELASSHTLSRVAGLFQAHPDLGLVQLRVEPREGGVGPRDWVPRLRSSTRERPGEVTLVWEGALAMRRSIFDEVGGWEESYRIIHEGVDLAWRVMDRGYRVWYAADLVAKHPMPAAAPARHEYSRYYGARNRVWVARRFLPLPLAVVYVVSFAARTLPMLLRSPGDMRPALRGYRDGVRQPRPKGRKLRFRTIWRMTRAGRPPIV